MANNFKCFTNKDCEYYPCHDVNFDRFNCLFCFCPLYNLNNCGGKYELLSNGIKDCSNCTIIHKGEKAHLHVMSVLNKHQ